MEETKNENQRCDFHPPAEIANRLDELFNCDSAAAANEMRSLSAELPLRYYVQLSGLDVPTDSEHSVEWHYVLKEFMADLLHFCDSVDLQLFDALEDGTRFFIREQEEQRQKELRNLVK